MSTKKTRMDRSPRNSLLLAIIAVGAALGGCEVDSFIDPSKTGRFEFMATSIPVLDSIDVIESNEEPWGQTTSVTPDDLVPNDLSYRLAPGDVLTVQIFELYAPGVWHVSTRGIDPGGFFRLPEIGDVGAAGMTPQEFEDRVTGLLHENVMQNPIVDVVVEQGGGFSYTISGAVVGPGMYNLRTPDLRLSEAIAIAGGVAPHTEHIFVIRQIELSDEVLPGFERGRGPAVGPGGEPDPPISIDDLIRDINPGGDDGGVRPGAMWQQSEPITGVDELEPIRSGQPVQVDVDDVGRGGSPDRPGNDTFIFDEQRGEWVRVGPDHRGAGVAAAEPSGQPLLLERVIQVPYQRLKRGDSSYDIVIRPDDRIYVEESLTGVVYLDGEVIRAGVYTLPPVGKLTVSRLVAAAGGLGGLAIPQRVDLTRVVGSGREATVRLDLKAIRNRTEPDIFLKPDDHIIIGTNFWAFPLAVIRNGLRATYGYGFILDRNFGNDVFGAPPGSFGTGQ